MTDKNLYFDVQQELKSGAKDERLWIKAMSITRGDIEKATWTYIELRVQELSVEKTTPVSSKTILKPDVSPEINSHDNLAPIHPGGVLLLILGFFGLLISGNMDTTRATLYGVQNIHGLVVQQQEYFVVSGIILTCGIALILSRILPKIHPIKRWGIILFLFGAVGVFLSVSMDTTVNGFNNLGYLAQQQNYLIISCIILVSGIALMIINFVSKNNK